MLMWRSCCIYLFSCTWICEFEQLEFNKKCLKVPEPISRKIQIHKGSLLNMFIANHQTKPPMQLLCRICNSIHIGFQKFWTLRFVLNVEEISVSWVLLKWIGKIRCPTSSVHPLPPNPSLFMYAFSSKPNSPDLYKFLYPGHTKPTSLNLFKTCVVFDTLIKWTVSRYILQYLHSGTIHARHVDLHLPRHDLEVGQCAIYIHIDILIRDQWILLYYIDTKSSPQGVKQKQQTTTSHKS